MMITFLVIVIIIIIIIITCYYYYYYYYYYCDRKGSSLYQGWSSRRSVWRQRADSWASGSGSWSWRSRVSRLAWRRRRRLIAGTWSVPRREQVRKWLHSVTHSGLLVIKISTIHWVTVDIWVTLEIQRKKYMICFLLSNRLSFPRMFSYFFRQYRE